MDPADLPLRAIRARTVRVRTPGQFDAMLNLGFGQHGRRRVYFEGGLDRRLGADATGRAMHYMTCLIGGKDLLLVTAETDAVELPLTARVFLDARAYHDPPEMACPLDAMAPDCRLLDVGAFFLRMAAAGFPPDGWRTVLNGKPAPQSR